MLVGLRQLGQAVLQGVDYTLEHRQDSESARRAGACGASWSQ
jgi:hypothetical protein